MKDLKIKVETYDPDKRAADKAASRAEDERMLEAGEITREELQHVNGGYGMFRKAKIIKYK